MTNDDRNDGGAPGDEQKGSIAALAAENTYAKQSKWRTLRELPAADKWPYFAQHFLIGTVAVVAVIAVVVSLAVTMLTRPPQAELSVAGVGMGEYTAQLDELKRGFVKAEGIDDERLVDVDGSFALADKSGNSYTDDSAKLMTMVSAGDITMIIADKATFAELVHRGLIGKISAAETDTAALDRLAAAGALVDAKGEPIDTADVDGTSSSGSGSVSKAYGLDLSESSMWTGIKGLPDDAVIGFANVSDPTHASRARDLVDYLKFE